LGVKGSENSSSERKRFKGSVVKGLIVYTRERKSRFNWSNGISENGHEEVWGFTPISVSPTMESVVNSPEAAQNESNLTLDGEATGGVSAGL
jgi:hypothetical protein